MSNPLSPQNEINRIPMLTCADYAYNPGSYDPMRSIGQAIVHLARTRSQQEVLKEVVEAYPGMLLYNKGTGFNPVREKAVELAKQPDGKSRQETYVAGVAQLLENFNLAFPDQFRDCARTIADDLAWLQENLRH
jgi:hypothetical protein